MTERECSSTPLFRGRSQQCCLLALFPVARQKRERERGGGGGGTEKKNARHISGKQMLRNAKFLRAAVLCFPKAFKALNGAEKYSPTAQCRRATLFFASIITVNCSFKKGGKKGVAPCESICPTRCAGNIERSELFRETGGNYSDKVEKVLLNVPFL